MTQTSARSSSLQRGARAGSVKRGQRGQTPRRLSDLQERPAWDATSSNLDRFKLSAEEQERRKASRVSKNRPLASSDGKRAFVEAWARHVTSSVLRGEDTEHDQDRPRSNSVTRDLPINYSNVVEMLRKSPSATAGAIAPADVRAIASKLHVQGGIASVSSPSGSGVETTAPSPETTAQPLLFGGASAIRGAGSSTGKKPEEAAAPTGSAIAPVPSSSSPGSKAAQGSDAAKGRDTVDAAKGTATAAGAGAPPHRGDVSITPAALRPRFNPAEATTIIAYGENSDDDGAQIGMDSPVYSASAMARAGGAHEGDSIAAAFEAALFGRGATAGGAGGPNLAWAATSRSGASPIDIAATGVERRLRALEAALGPSGGVGGAGSVIPHEDMAELRRQLRQVQSDNAKLRQELGAFSSHASMLLTQLQAQVHALLRPSDGGAGAANGVRPPAYAPAPFPSARLQQAASARQMQQPMGFPAGAATSVPTTAAAAVTAAAMHDAVGGHVQHGAVYPSQPSTAYQAQQAPLQQSGLHAPSQPIARRNIFADLDISSLRPFGPAVRIGAGRGAGEGDAASSSSAATPHTAYRSTGGSPHAAYRPTGGYAPVASASPPIDVAAVPCAPYSVPVRVVDDTEVVLPSFAAFRRSAGAATFTSARPATNGATPGPLSSPHLATAHGTVANVVTAEPERSRISPSGGPAVQQRPLPTQYQPRSLGGVIVRPGGNKPLPAATSVGAVAAAAAGGANAASGAYVTAVTANAAAAIATGSDAAAAALARTHSGLPQPLVFSVGPEFRSARATGLSAENSMSLSAHTAAAAAARSKASGPSSR